MPTIPYPNVPPYPGVPALPRSGPGQPEITMSLGPTQPVLVNALQAQTNWGIFDAASGAQLGAAGDAVLSTNTFEFTKETRISDFPIEKGGFASYNKVEVPANPIVTLAFAGSETERTSFLNAIDAACKSTDLYNVVTPEVTYVNYSLERYNLTRRSQSGVTLLIVEISIKEIRQVSATFSSTQANPINDPQNPAAVNPTSQGIIQPLPPSTSVLKSVFNNFPNLMGGGN